MGQAKYNPVAIAAKKGELPPKKRPEGTRETMRKLERMIAWRAYEEVIRAKYFTEH